MVSDGSTLGIVAAMSEPWGSSGGYLPPPPASLPPSYQRYGGPPAVLYAGFGSRLGAFLIDGVIVAIPFVALYLLLAVPFLRGTTCVTDATTGASSCDVNLGAGVWAVVGVWLVMMLAVPILYFVVPVGRSGRTLGMRIVGIRVVGVVDLRPIGIGRASARYLVQYLFSGLICYLGFFWMLWDDRNQTWHAKAASSIVIMD